jgi:hypothetical protein
MVMHRLSGFITLAVTVATVAAAGAQGTALARGEAEQLKRKVASIADRSRNSPRSSARTTVTEREVNAFLAFEAASDFPAGVVDPRISIHGADRVTARAVVDLDQVRQQRNPTSLLDPVQYLRGRLPVSATGLVHARNGVATLELESADIAGVPVPKFILQQIVSHYSRSASRPAGISLDEPMALPARIRDIQVEPGLAIVIQ